MVQLVSKWQATSDEYCLEEIFQCVKQMIHILILKRGILDFMEEEEVTSLIFIKLWKGIRHYDPSKGSKLYSYITKIINNRISQCQIDNCNENRIETISLDCHLTNYNLEETNKQQTSNDNKLYYHGIFSEPCHHYDEHAVDDLVADIMSIKTMCLDPKEREAQKWLVHSFIDSGFLIKRYDAANAMTTVYGIEKMRARHIHDLTILEIRRKIIYRATLPDVDYKSLKGNMQRPLLDYYYYLTQEEFNRLVFLMRGLSPYIIEDINDILYGFVGSIPLFDTVTYLNGNY